MKKITKVVAIIIVTFIVSSFTHFNNKKEYTPVTEITFEIPENVQKILEKSCVGCHNSNSKSKKSKMKFNIDKLTNGKYSKKKIASKLRKLVKLINTDNKKKIMPPKKFVNKYPDRAISEEEIQILTNWAKEQNNAN